MAIHNRENLHALAAFGEAYRVSLALGCGKRGIDETLALINGAFVAQRVNQLGEDLAQHILVTPLLESSMDGFVVGIALWREVPLRPGVRNPEHCFQDRLGWDGMGLRPGRESDRCSSGKCSRIRSQWSSRSRSMLGLIRVGNQAVNYFEIGSSHL